jgi:hypothetical protein
MHVMERKSIGEVPGQKCDGYLCKITPVFLSSSVFPSIQDKNPRASYIQGGSDISGTFSECH